MPLKKILVILFVTSCALAYSNHKKYPSQQGQDKWVIEEVFNYKKNGYFIEAGASDGVFLSNTFILETAYNWNGLCVEPHPKAYNQLIKNRKCHCVQACLDNIQQEVDFLYIDDIQRSAFGGIIAPDTDFHPDSERTRLFTRSCNIIKIKTQILENILDELDAPKIIDYFSLDVEGAENRILTDSLLDKYTFLSMSIERPSPQLNARLKNHGYLFVRNLKHDTLYVHSSHPNLSNIKRMPFKQITWRLQDYPKYSKAKKNSKKKLSMKTPS